MSALRCSYHPEKVAVTTCQRCHRPICLEDKRIHQQSYSHGNGTISGGTTHEYCLLCYVSQKDHNFTLSIAGLIIFLVFIFICFNMFTSYSIRTNVSMDNSIFSLLSNTIIFFIILISLLLFGGIIYFLLQANKVVDEAIIFKLNLNQKKHQASSKYSSFIQLAKPLYLKISSVSQINCYDCGAKLELEDKNCPNYSNNSNNEKSFLQKG